MLWVNSIFILFPLSAKLPTPKNYLFFYVKKAMLFHEYVLSSLLENIGDVRSSNIVFVGPENFTQIMFLPSGSIRVLSADAEVSLTNSSFDFFQKDP